MGLLGLVAGPIAFGVARSLHQATAEALDVAPAAGASGTLIAVAVLKGLEYGALGLLIGYIGRQTWGDLKAHLGTGLALGVVFGGAIVAVTASATAGPTSSLVPQLVNEVAFPMGCALVLYVSAAVARHAAE